MGIVLSPDGNSLWFAEIIGGKIASFDIQSEKLCRIPDRSAGMSISAGRISAGRNDCELLEHPYISIHAKMPRASLNQGLRTQLCNDRL
jgi:hypothetical protein